MTESAETKKGMKFYLCQTEVGPQLVHLQADAKKIDPNFETILIDLSKQAIMDRLNDLMRQAHAPAAPMEEASPVSVSPPPPSAPKKLDKAAQYMERVFDQTAVEEFIWRVPSNETFRLDTIENICRERRAEIKEELKQ